MTQPGPRPRVVSTQQLVDLVLDLRDPGYEAAAHRRGGTGPGRRFGPPLVAACCAVIGFVLALSWVQTHRGAPAAAQVHDALVQRVRAAQSTDTELTATEAALNARLDRLRGAVLPDSSVLLRSLTELQLQAGQIAATGPGLQVLLSEPATSVTPTLVPGRGDRAPITGGHILIDRDLRSVVNELWSGGAEAIAVNGIRLTPTSAVRFAGDAVLVDFQPIDSPYVIEAIGDSDQLSTGFASSAVASRYQTLAGADGIGFSFSEQRALALPASPGMTLRFARPARGSR